MGTSARTIQRKALESRVQVVGEGLVPCEVTEIHFKQSGKANNGFYGLPPWELAKAPVQVELQRCISIDFTPHHHEAIGFKCDTNPIHAQDHDEPCDTNPIHAQDHDEPMASVKFAELEVSPDEIGGEDSGLITSH